jgi:hypothetical protein
MEDFFMAPNAKIQPLQQLANPSEPFYHGKKARKTLSPAFWALTLKQWFQDR